MNLWAYELVKLWVYVLRTSELVELSIYFNSL
jgi:hypothetical protein